MANITIQAPSPSRQPVEQPPPDKSPDAWANAVPEYGDEAATAPPPAAQQPPQHAQSDATSWADKVPEYNPTQPEEAPPRRVETSEAIARGVFRGLTFGAAAPIAGLAEASGIPSSVTNRDELDLNPIRPIVGAAKLLHGFLGDHPDPEVSGAYQRGRENYRKEEDLSSEQHFWPYMVGQLFGGLLVPASGLGAGAKVSERVLQGVRSGGVGGAAYGTLDAVGDNKSAEDVIKGGLTGGTIGGALGGTIGGMIGKRAINPSSPGRRAAATADKVGAPLPRGVTSDSKIIQNTTAKLRGLPIIGDRISRQVHATEHAAGEHIDDVAASMAGGNTSRAAADYHLRPALQKIIDDNLASQNAAYNALRAKLGNQNTKYVMPNLLSVLNRITASRAAAGHSNPMQGLDQFLKVAQGATFDGAHRARVDARNAGNVLAPNPGYNAGDFNQIVRAMTADLKGIVQKTAGWPLSGDAIKLFNEAEANFGRLAEQNKILNRLVGAKGEGAISALLGAAREKGGDIKLLVQLKQSMSPQEFSHIGGVLLSELGARPATGEFSLAQFTTNLNKISDHALNVLFSPQHANDIREIAGMGQHMKKALAESSSSHSGGLLVMFELARHAAAAVADIAAGTHGVATGVSLGASGAGGVLAHWLGTPATARSMATFTRVYSGVVGGTVSASKLAAFNVATRNLANNLGVPVENVMRTIQGNLSAAAEPTAEQQPQ